MAMTANFGIRQNGETLMKGKTAMSTQTAKLVARIAENLPDMSTSQMQGWIENPKALQKLLSGLNPPVNGSATELKVWKTLKLCLGIDADAYCKAIRAKKMRIGDYANDIIGKPAFSVASKEVELDLVVVSVADLGFKDGAKLKDIFARAKKKGLQLCPNQVGPELRLQYEDQPKGERVIIGMVPITDSDGDLRLFRVVRSVLDLWLSTYYAYPGFVWSEYYRFVFVLPRK